MTKLLEQAVQQVRQLPNDQQDAIATLILQELEDEARWDAAFANSPELLERLAAEAEAEDRAGLTRDLKL
ncbi:MAG: hypothetical protein AB7U20_06520 [Planctomycetaceae bacterium]